LRPLLEPGEELLWSGRPRQGLVLHPHDRFFVPFSFAWAALAGAGVFLVLFRLPPGRIDAELTAAILLFLVVGLSISVGRFAVDMRIRATTAYGVTDRRVLIVSRFPWPKTTSRDLVALAELTVVETSSGRGWISFAASARGLKPFSGLYNASLRSRFESIAEPRAVYDLILSARERALRES
jgi:hypothetical protein